MIWIKLVVCPKKLFLCKNFVSFNLPCFCTFIYGFNEDKGGWEISKKLLTSIVAVALFLGIGTAALAHSNSTPTQGNGNGNWQQMMDYCSEMMNSFMNNHQNNIPNETSTSKNLNTGQTHSINSMQSTTNNHQYQKHTMYDDC